jgi:hypothetical protein
MELFDTKKTIVLVVRFLINGHFLFLNRNSTTSFLFSNQKRIEKE